MTTWRSQPWWAIVVLTLVVLLGVFAPLVTSYDPERPELSERLEPPSWSLDRSSHTLGTDALGRDILSRIAFGARVTLLVALVALTFGAVVGVVVGLLAGYFGRWCDAILMRIVDAALGFPAILIALLLAVSLGSSLLTLTIAIGAVIWARFARVVRGEVLRVRESDFVLLARVSNCSNVRIILSHVLPNLAGTVIVLVTLEVAVVILIEAGLSFLGVGVPPPTPSWGQMVGDGRNFIDTAWWIAAVPGALIMLVVLSVNRLGDWLRDMIDPSLKEMPRGL